MCAPALWRGHESVAGWPVWLAAWRVRRCPAADVTMRGLLGWVQTMIGALALRRMYPVRRLLLCIGDGGRAGSGCRLSVQLAASQAG